MVHHRGCNTARIAYEYMRLRPVAVAPPMLGPRTARGNRLSFAKFSFCGGTRGCWESVACGNDRGMDLQVRFHLPSMTADSCFELLTATVTSAGGPAAEGRRAGGASGPAPQNEGRNRAATGRAASPAGGQREMSEGEDALLVCRMCGHAAARLTVAAARAAGR